MTYTPAFATRFSRYRVYVPNRHTRSFGYFRAAQNYAETEAARLITGVDGISIVTGSGSDYREVARYVWGVGAWSWDFAE